MRKLISTIGIALALTTGALAQSPMPQQQTNPEVQALGAKLMDEINSEIGWRARAMAAEAKVKELQGEVERMAHMAPVAPSVPEKK